MKIIPLAVPTPFYIGDVNVYLIKEDPLTLIDVGPKTVEAETVLREKLGRHGVVFSDIKRILLTHTHDDHCGLAKRIFDEAKDAKIFVHEWENGNLFGVRESAAMSDLMRRAGVPEATLAALRKIYENSSRYCDAMAKETFSTLKNGAEIEFASGVLQTWHTPGHTPGSCSFWREADRTLIAGDTILKRVTPNPLIAPDPFDQSKRFNSLGEYLVSLAKIKSHAPTLIYGGHGESVDDFDELFHRSVRSIDERQKRIVALVSEKGTTVFDCAAALFPNAMTDDFHCFLAVSEVSAHLDYAVSESKIAVESNGVTEIFRQL